MGLYYPKPILEIPSQFGWSNSISLEEAIKRDFGNKAIERLNAHNLLIEAPINSDFRLIVDYYGELKDSPGNPSVIGKIYQVITNTDNGKIDGIIADNVRVCFDKRLSDGSFSLHLRLDLNPENPSSRYLKLLFEYR